MIRLWLHEPVLRLKEIEVPNLKDPIALNLVAYKGIHCLGLVPGTMVNMWSDPNCYEKCYGRATIFDVKHLVLGDINQYKMLLKDYYHKADVAKSYIKFKQHLQSLYDGIIDGEIVTLVFFTPEQDLINGIGSTEKDSQSS
ncbi:MAG: hypothetical protein GY934_09695 [Gammaproteobacteria bacterium]|nr:hypothetical protein [Gammaproteobacteria bacterium]